MPFWHFLQPPFVTSAKTAFVTTHRDDRVKYPLFKNLLNINEVKKSLQQKKNRIREAIEKKKKRPMPLGDTSKRKVVKKLNSSKNDPSIDDIKMDISY